MLWLKLKVLTEEPDLKDITKNQVVKEAEESSKPGKDSFN